MNLTSTQETNETAPLTPANDQKPYSPVGEVGRTFGTIYFLSSTLLASVIPIIELVIGLYYKGQCPIDQRIPTYMIVAGVCGLVLVGLSILLSITFMCFISDSTALTLFASCGICLNVTVTFIISVFVFIWFILGCVWVFSIHNEVQFHNQSKGNYCEPVLYKGAFVLLIITIVWAAIQCCLSCFRNCCVGRSA